MQEIKELIDILRVLRGPDGCPWDRKQTFEMLRSKILEETHEVIDAVNRQEMDHLAEELGDLLINILLYSLVAEEKGSFSFEKIAKTAKEKLIRRHPHIFEEKKELSLQELELQWKAIKAAEGKASAGPSHPHHLPALAQAQHIHKTLAQPSKKETFSEEEGELSFGKKIYDLVVEAAQQGVDAEQALLKMVHFLLDRRVQDLADKG